MPRPLPFTKYYELACLAGVCVWSTGYMLLAIAPAQPLDLAAVATPRILELAPGITYEPNPSTGSAVWVAEWVTAESLAGAAERPGRFLIDEHLHDSSQRASERDYRNSGFDKGHLAASANWGAHRAATFNLSNVVPQVPLINQGPMKFLEDSLRARVTDRTSLLIVTAPLYQLGHKPRFAGRLPVPTAMVKAVLVFHDNQPVEGLAFLIENTRSGELKTITVDDVETLLQRDLFAALPDDVENRLEGEQPNGNR
jgi:endonuclease G